ncbi:37S ribosomal protein S22 [Coemansia sp. RSA 1200]|nr:37S ribosomal protein S22 [Coemansia sp. RSA 1200]
MLPLLVRLVGARARARVAQGGVKTAAIAAPARGRTQPASTQYPGGNRRTHSGSIRQTGDPGPVDRMNSLSTQDKDNGATATELFDEHGEEEEEEEEEEPGFRGTDEMRFGVKYIGMVELPHYIREAIEAHVRPLDKKALRHDYLRLADSIRSMNAITPRGKGGGKKAAEQREEDLMAGRNSHDEDPEGGVRRRKKGSPKPHKMFKPLPGEHVDVIVPGQRPAPQSLVRPSIRLKPHVLEFGRYETDAYVATVVPATYGPIFNVLLELADRLPGFSPASVLDFGCGPAPVLWAAQEIWGPVGRYLGVDVSEEMLQCAESLVAGVPRHRRAQNIEFARYLAPFPTATTSTSTDSSGNPDAGGTSRFDLVVAAFTLSDLPSDAMRKSTVETLWRRTRDTLVLIDRGSPNSARMVGEARTQLLELERAAAAAAGGSSKAAPPSSGEPTVDIHTFAPFANDLPDPTDRTTAWIHFSQRIQRPMCTMLTKKSKTNVEDLRYTYVVMRRGQRPPPAAQAENEPPAGPRGSRTPVPRAQLARAAHHWARAVLPPIKRKGHVIVDVATREGALQRWTFTRSHDRTAYRDARKARWGDLIPHLPKLVDQRPQFKAAAMPAEAGGGSRRARRSHCAAPAASRPRKK